MTNTMQAELSESQTDPMVYGHFRDRSQSPDILLYERLF